MAPQTGDFGEGRFDERYKAIREARVKRLTDELDNLEAALAAVDDERKNARNLSADLSSPRMQSLRKPYPIFERTKQRAKLKGQIEDVEKELSEVYKYDVDEDREMRRDPLVVDS